MPGRGPLSSHHESWSGSSPGLTRSASQGGVYPVWPGPGARSPDQRPEAGRGLGPDEDTGASAMSGMAVAVAVGATVGTGVRVGTADGLSG